MHTLPSTPRQSKSQFYRTFLPGGGDLEMGVVHLVVLNRLLMVTTKKSRQLFGGKCTPDKILATPTLARCHTREERQTIYCHCLSLVPSLRELTLAKNDIQYIYPNKNPPLQCVPSLESAFRAFFSLRLCFALLIASSCVPA